jgi:hypothetical protein
MRYDVGLSGGKRDPEILAGRGISGQRFSHDLIQRLREIAGGILLHRPGGGDL